MHQQHGMHHLTIAGPVLASLLSAACAGRACDGLLLGDVCITTSMQAHDTSDALLVQEAVGRLSGSCACAGSQSFYTGSGAIKGEALQQLLDAVRLGSGPRAGGLLGWFSFRPDSPGVPSMREAAVCKHLHAWLSRNSSAAAAVCSSSSSGSSGCEQQQVPLVFGLITSSRDHSGATLSLQYRFYHYQPGGSTAGSSSSSSSGSGSGANNSRAAQQPQPKHPLLTPLDLRVQNLGQPGLACSSSSSRGGLQQLPALAAAVGGDAAGAAAGPLAGGLQGQLLEAARLAASVQLPAVEGLYASLLDELQLAVGQLTAKQDGLKQLRTRNEQLRAQLRQATRAAAAAGAGGEAAGAAPPAPPLLPAVAPAEVL